jgi:hypothetical protein
MKERKMNKANQIALLLEIAISSFKSNSSFNGVTFFLGIRVY